MAQESTTESMLAKNFGKQDGHKIRRNSTGKPNSSSSGRIPNYLRASTGSCHDFCKYGKLHDFEENAKTPIPRRTKPPPRSKKPTFGKLKQSPDVTSVLPVNPKIAQHEGSSSPFRNVSPKLASPDYGKTSLSSKLATEGQNSRRNSDVGIGQRKGTSQVEKKASASVVDTLSCKPSLHRVLSLKKQSRSLKVVSNLKTRNMVRKSEPDETNKDMGGKTLYASIPAATSPKPPLDGAASLNAIKQMSPNGTAALENQKLIRKSETEQFKDKGTSRVMKNLEADFPLKSLNSKEEFLKSNNEESPIQFVKIQTDQSGSPHDQLNSPSRSPKSLPHLNSPFLSSHEEDEQGSEYTVTDEDNFTSEDDETAKLNPVRTSELEYKRRPKKGGSLLSEYEDSAPTKLKFRRGKVIDLQSDEHNGPKRLRFRQARMLGDNENVNRDAGRRIYKRRVKVVGPRISDSSSEKVDLRHQEAEGKKDGQGLFNNVIEETASKLAETRKSKVKALVGAFETVISLQDTKPPTNAVS